MKKKARFNLKVALRSSAVKEVPAPEPSKPSTVRTYPDTKIKEQIAANKRDQKEKDLEKAVAYCQENNVRGYAAIAAGKAGSIKDRRTINARLDGIVSGVAKRPDSRLMTDQEEEALVRFWKNKNRSLDGIDRSQATKYIHDCLKVRDYMNKKSKGGREYQPLSKAGKSFLKTKKLSKSFWRRFETQYKSLARKKQGNASGKRVLACSEKRVREYADELAEELISTGIFENAEKIESGVWTGTIDTSRVFNHDEMPQFVDYGVSSSMSRGLVYCGKGEECKRYKDENRECVTIEPFVNLSGEMIMCHVIFPGTCISSNMAPENSVNKISNLLVSTTDSGYQEGRTCYESYKTFEKAIREKKVKRPVVVLTDGHGSRFASSVMQFCRNKKINQFVSLPDATEILQLLDQVFSNLHRCYENTKEDLFEGDRVSREGFMNILAEVWETWTSQEALVKAAKRVGISPTGINVNDMQTEKFAREEAVTQSTPHKTKKPLLENVSPQDCRRGTTEYWRKRCQNVEAREAEYMADNEMHKSLSPDEVPGLLTCKKRSRPEQTKPVRVTQVHGSMEGKKILEEVDRLRQEKEEQEQLKTKKKKEKEEKLVAFVKCKDKCVCSRPEGKCAAFNLRRCSECGNIVKQSCGKAACKAAGRIMIIPVSAQGKRKKEISNSESEEADMSEGDEVLDMDDDEPMEEWRNGMNDSSTPLCRSTRRKADGQPFRKYAQKLSMEENEVEVDDEEQDDEEQNEEEQEECPSSSTKFNLHDDAVVAKAQDCLEDKHIGKFFCVYYDDDRYWAKLMKVFAEDSDAPADKIEVNFLHYKYDGVWDHPKGGEIQIIKAKYVFWGPCVPKSTSKEGYTFEEDQVVLDLYKRIKKNNA